MNSNSNWSVIIYSRFGLDIDREQTKATEDQGNSRNALAMAYKEVGKLSDERNRISLAMEAQSSVRPLLLLMMYLSRKR